MVHYYNTGLEFKINYKTALDTATQNNEGLQYLKVLRVLMLIVGMEKKTKRKKKENFLRNTVCQGVQVTCQYRYKITLLTLCFGPSQKPLRLLLLDVNEGLI